MSDDPDITDGSGNVFADLAFDDPEEEPAKARLTALIGTISEQRGLSDAGAASVLQMERERLSALLEGDLGEVSTERLFRLLTALDHNVETSVTPSAPSQRRASITVRTEPEPAISGDR